MATTLNIRLPSVGCQEEGRVTQAVYDELLATAQDNMTMLMLSRLAGQAGHSTVAFVTYGEDGIGVMDDGDSELVLALGNDILYPEDPDESVSDILKGMIAHIYEDSHDQNSPTP